MFALNASVVPNSTSQLVRSELQRVGQTKTIVNSSLPLLRPLKLQPATFGGKKQSLQMKSAAFVCAAAALVDSVRRSRKVWKPFLVALLFVSSILLN